MAANLRRCPGFPWDSPAGDGIHTGVLPDTGFDSGTRFRLGKRSAEGIYPRVRAWQLSGGMHIAAVGGGFTADGFLSIAAPAVSHATAGGVLLGNERDVAKHGGWYGEDLHPAAWTDGDGHSFDPGFLSLRLGDVTGVVSGAVTFGPILTFQPNDIPLSFGAGVDIAALCDGGLPITHEGSFDGYDEDARTFTLKIGGPVGFDVTSTGMTLHPVLYWPYDTEDGNGRVYHPDTGAWERDASAFR